MATETRFYREQEEERKDEFESKIEHYKESSGVLDLRGKLRTKQQRLLLLQSPTAKEAVHSILLSRNYIQNLYLPEIHHFCEQFRNLQYIDLSCNAFTADCWPSLFTLLSLASVRYLNVSDNYPLSGVESSSVLSRLEDSKLLKLIWESQSELSSEGWRHILNGSTEKKETVYHLHFYFYYLHLPRLLGRETLSPGNKKYWGQVYSLYQVSGAGTVSAFLQQPLRDLESVPGIGPTTATHLNAKGISSTGKLIAQFLNFDRDIRAFTNWLEATVPAALTSRRAACVGQAVALKVGIMFGDLISEDDAEDDD